MDHERYPYYFSETTPRNLTVAEIFEHAREAFLAVAGILIPGLRRSA